MAPIVAPGLARFTVNQTYGGNDIANIIDMQIDTTGSDQSRSDACEAVAEDILENWDEHIRAFQVAALTCDSVSWVDLDDLDGSTGTVTQDSDASTVWPAAGGNAVPGLPGNTALLVVKTSGGGRRARNGKWFLCGMGEYLTSGSPNEISGSEIGPINEALQDFLEGVTDQSPDDEPQRQFVVLHTVDGVYTSYDDVDALLAQTTLATQRRRLRD